MPQPAPPIACYYTDAYRGVDGAYAPISRHIEGSTADLIRDGHDRPVPWMYGRASERYGTRTLWLLGRGYSASPDRRARLHDAGAVTMAINDIPDGAPRTDLWVTGDPPHYFRPVIWDDPAICKFVPLWHADKMLGREHAYVRSRTPRDCPNVHFYHAMCNQSPGCFLDAPWANWGTAGYGPDDRGGLRSSMLAALRIAYHLGFRRLNLLGCDLVPDQHPNPDYTTGLADLLRAIQPALDLAGVEIRQANPDAYLRVYPVVPFEHAIKETEPS